MRKLHITILAGGAGKRMNSQLPKVLHMVGKKTMIVRIIEQCQLLKPDQIFIVVGKFAQEIKTEISEKITDCTNITFVTQPIPLGTGDAVKHTLPYLPDNIINLILNGDVPLLQYETIKDIYHEYLKNKLQLLITAIELNNPTGCGRIILDSNNVFREIIEERDCNPEQKAIKLVNCGIYIIQSDILRQLIPIIQNNNSQSEYYLTDIIKIYKEKYGSKIDLFILPPSKYIEIFNINTHQQLLEICSLISE